MIYKKIGTVISLEIINKHLWEIFVALDDNNGTKEKALLFPNLTGTVSRGDRIILNTTAVELGLGTGGYHFVIANLSRQDNNFNDYSPGHIMKLRYTPLQMKVLSVEEKKSPYHEMIKRAESLEGTPVVCGSLHSMLVPCVCAIKAEQKDLRIAYVMTDGGALPLAFSKAVQKLNSLGYFCGTVTVGNAFGGDLEAVNIYSGLVAAKKVFAADIVLVFMGPGVVGTGTCLGNTGLEVGQIINAVNSLQGKAYTIPRISFADKRERHRGVSHHTLTALERIALSKTCVVLCHMKKEQKRIVLQQLAGVSLKHELAWGHGNKGIKFAKEKGLSLYHMGRNEEEDPVFFYTAAAAGEFVAQSIIAGKKM